MHETGLLDLLTGSGRPCTSSSCVVQHGAFADWWYSRPMASTLASLCLSQRRIYWTYVETINLFSLYLMNFILHSMLDATGVVLRVHYTSIKCDVLFFQGSVGTVFRWDGHFSFLPLYNSAKIIKIDQGCTKLWSQMYCHLFMVHGVHLVLSVIHIIFHKLLEFIIIIQWRYHRNVTDHNVCSITTGTIMFAHRWKMSETVCRLNAMYDCAVLVVAGGALQARAVTTGNARSPSAASV